MVVVAMQMWPGRPLILTALKLKWQKGHHLQKKTISKGLDNTLLKKKVCLLWVKINFKQFLYLLILASQPKKTGLIQLYFQSDNSNQTQFEPNNMITVLARPSHRHFSWVFASIVIMFYTMYYLDSDKGQTYGKKIYLARFFPLNICMAMF